MLEIAGASEGRISGSVYRRKCPSCNGLRQCQRHYRLWRLLREGGASSEGAALQDAPGRTIHPDWHPMYGSSTLMRQKRF